ncbi:hypothetical protein EAL2_808p07070 (plasmid) [Peptoclostridium acidaminophilum DSM 3953]|uniref:Uncharacterized protein n=1 Tax=Peptoclostridium acidaminophilum DSM 3953 TaxID=1286171 RepID=W8TBK4_PEPAC|nr:hypothetical protein [Peptoclostridium acidaminophilum]AHM58210.1 hypothetical protein EAL2_808p07070 [Peptoclostridium acidaminophilum DSM 3953]
MGVNITKMEDIHGDYIEIEYKGQTMRFGYEIAEDGEIMSDRVVAANEHAIDLVIKNTDKFDWDGIFAMHGHEAIKLIEQTLKELGFSEVCFFTKK